MTKAKKFVLARKFNKLPKQSDFKLVVEELPPIKDGEILVEALWLSVDPYMRVYVDKDLGLSTSGTIPGSQIAKVLESKDPNFKVGQYVVGSFGWRTKSVHNASNDDQKFSRTYVLQDFKGLPLSLGLGVLGMPGNTAYFGLMDICQPKPGDVVVVSGAAGAVGSLVGQIAKIIGCKVIGFAGSDEKVKWLKNDLGFDAAYNYKTKDITEALKEAAPNGVDCYFDNVGGSISSAVIHKMKPFGRVAVCGSISAYNDLLDLPTAPVIQPSVVFNQLRIEGFIYFRWNDRWFEGIKQLLSWVLEGKLKYHETVTEGFENMPKAFVGMLRGDNVGKSVVKA